MNATPQAPRISWLQHALTIGVAARSIYLARRLRAGREVERQEATRRELQRGLALTEFGRAQGIRAALAAKEFRERVPLRTYESLAPWIERMKRGETDVLWPGRCRYFAISSGTTVGRTKYLPITAEMLAHFRRAGLDSLSFYVHRAGSAQVFGGRHLMLGGSVALAPLGGANARDALAGDLSGIAALHLPRWVERHLYEPGREIARLSDWPEKLRAIALRTARRDVRLLAGIPTWILIFAETLRAVTGEKTLQAVWPGLRCVVHGGVPLAPFARELRAVLGPGVHFHEVFPASEAFIAAQDGEPEAGLRLLTDAGIFYEFLPLSQFDESRLPELGAKAVTLGDVQCGVDYALLLTTPGGLCRYVIGDVVRFVSTRPPRLVYVGRTRLQLSAFGEHVIEKEITDALAAVCARRGLSIVNFHVAPEFVDSAAARKTGRHEWWIELKTPGAACFDPAQAADEIDRELQRLNDDYEAKRKGGALARPRVHLVPDGTFERWLRARGKWGGQNKTPRCSSDRGLADELKRELDRAARSEMARTI
ncbi:MAG TPA: GH3 auxin-responsive promoter family protein [Opitutaceae bacterium]|nr:GH3 auxin-responsive promoter family protein [Opitutaceae bacterium]